MFEACGGEHRFGDAAGGDDLGFWKHRAQVFEEFDASLLLGSRGSPIRQRLAGRVRVERNDSLEHERRRAHVKSLPYNAGGSFAPEFIAATGALKTSAAEERMGQQRVLAGERNAGETVSAIARSFTDNDDSRRLSEKRLEILLKIMPADRCATRSRIVGRVMIHQIAADRSRLELADKVFDRIHLERVVVVGWPS